MCCNLCWIQCAVILSHGIHVDAAQLQKRAERQRGLEALPMYESACVSFLAKHGVLSLLQMGNRLFIPFNMMMYTWLIWWVCLRVLRGYSAKAASCKGCKKVTFTCTDQSWLTADDICVVSWAFEPPEIWFVDKLFYYTYVIIVMRRLFSAIDRNLQANYDCLSCCLGKDRTLSLFDSSFSMLTIKVERQFGPWGDRVQQWTGSPPIQDRNL